jgi:hypothetical protein
MVGVNVIEPHAIPLVGSHLTTNLLNDLATLILCRRVAQPSYEPTLDRVI